LGVFGVLGEDWLAGDAVVAVTLRFFAILVSKFAFHLGHWFKINQQPS
jgi:hypothetical protein